MVIDPCPERVDGRKEGRILGINLVKNFCDFICSSELEVTQNSEMNFENEDVFLQSFLSISIQIVI